MNGDQTSTPLLMDKRGMTKLGINLCKVNPNGFYILRDWRREYTMEKILVELRKEMAAPHNRKLPQPPEGACY